MHSFTFFDSPFSTIDFINLFTAIATIALALAAFQQLRYIKKEKEPILDLVFVTTMVYVLYNHGANTAYKISIEINGHEYNIMHSLNSSEFFLISIDFPILNIKEQKSPIPSRTYFKVCYKHQFTSGITTKKIDLSILNKVYNYDINKLKNTCKYEIELHPNT